MTGGRDCGSVTEFLLDTACPMELPRAWTRKQNLDGPLGLMAHFKRKGGLVVLLAVENHTPGGGLWRHVSLSKPHKLPGWYELREVKDLFIGADALAIQVLPPASEYVNVHEYCLHLWQRLDAPTLPADVGRLR